MAENSRIEETAPADEKRRRKFTIKIRIFIANFHLEVIKSRTIPIFFSSKLIPRLTVLPNHGA